MILFEGPSLLDGKPIVVIATIKSDNEKTGDMVQTWILRQDIDPVTASRIGADASVCGACPLRGKANPPKASGVAAERACYVLLHTAPLQVWKSYRAGKYRRAMGIDAIAAVGAGRMVRLGSYGDMAAVPAWVSTALQRDAIGHTAYSHQAGNAASSFDAARYMVSVQSESEARAAWSRGQRTYRVVRDAADAVAGHEIECPASRSVKCVDCGLCSGAIIGAAKQPKSIVIPTHGVGGRYVATA